MIYISTSYQVLRYIIGLFFDGGFVVGDCVLVLILLIKSIENKKEANLQVQTVNPPETRKRPA